MCATACAPSRSQITHFLSYCLMEHAACRLWETGFFTLYSHLDSNVYHLLENVNHTRNADSQDVDRLTSGSPRRVSVCVARAHVRAQVNSISLKASLPPPQVSFSVMPRLGLPSSATLCASLLCSSLFVCAPTCQKLESSSGLCGSLDFEAAKEAIADGSSLNTSAVSPQNSNPQSGSNLPSGLLLKDSWQSCFQLDELVHGQPTALQCRYA